MTSNGIDRDADGARRVDLVMTLALGAVAFVMTIYTLAKLAALMAQWFVRLY